ncbi:ribonuclease III [Helicobacter ailurogastricus]|uniref:ribonuclease III n=1 Tax=Helicobacter ailurogastricus TaxID=1578720 RepID=UPI0022C452A5|nr:ribonuclease III [Helicobacter ailurogastricus]GLH57223.1 Ribonuclease III Rnc [Helicobacter ailurogastricus]GLH59148.1 Ribonuclease III Rnc [Helicobacter ailurogastricus]
MLKFSNLNYTFKNQDLLQQALTHRSVQAAQNNERLEFLGDAVLDLAVAEILFERFHDLQEGDLSKMRASLVNEKAFFKLALLLDLQKHIVVSAAEAHNNGQTKPSILSSAFEALMGVIYLESGLEVVRALMQDLLDLAYPDLSLQALFTDYKSALQELTQERFKTIPTYILKGESGPDHAKQFEMQIFILTKLYATCKAKSKKEAQQLCAKEALKQLTQGAQ